MVGGAWPFLVGGAICLVNSDNERDFGLLNSGPVLCACPVCSMPRSLVGCGGCFAGLCGAGGHFLEGQVARQLHEVEQ